ncbi:MAG: Dam family site-specific DNA-(adenine-N6)-methyltransferase [Candidatus Omnitrophica bacterium]|nr:Dam family site-specific DNA-(adenine-N6)-methyltransferase [Candidatus Omnitrophota bacterium]
MKPFLKWAGGKRWLIPRLADKLPQYNRYFEPFLGSGSLFFALEPKIAILSDSNRELINCFRQIKSHCKDVVGLLRGLSADKNTYYKVRDSLYSEANAIQRAAYFIYLNKTCWNGLYRVNTNGRFNVPCGSLRSNALIFEEEHLIAVSKLLKSVELLCCDFEESIKDVKSGDLVYFDPPYVTTHLKNGFIGYNSKLFSQLDELRLAKLADQLRNKGALIVISNAAHPSIKQLYNGHFYKTEITRFSGIAADPERRSNFLELLVTNFRF